MSSAASVAPRSATAASARRWCRTRRRCGPRRRDSARALQQAIDAQTAVAQADRMIDYYEGRVNDPSTPPANLATYQAELGEWTAKRNTSSARHRLVRDDADGRGRRSRRGRRRRRERDPARREHGRPQRQLVGQHRPVHQRAQGHHRPHRQHRRLGRDGRHGRRALHPGAQRDRRGHRHDRRDHHARKRRTAVRGGDDGSGRGAPERRSRRPHLRRRPSHRLVAEEPLVDRADHGGDVRSRQRRRFRHPGHDSGCRACSASPP